MASTSQAAKWYEQPWFDGRIDQVTPEDYPKPDTFYGWAKVAYESLGFLYASRSLGSRLEVVQIRIVVPREVDAAAFVDRPLISYLRDITGYISQRDLQQLFTKSVDACRSTTDTVCPSRSSTACPTTHGPSGVSPTLAR